MEMRELYDKYHQIAATDEDVGDKVRQLLESLIVGSTSDFQAQIAQSID